MVVGKGLERGHLTDDEVYEYASQALSQVELKGKKVLVIIPDLTRNAPIPFFFKLLHEMVGHQVKRLDYLVALGTHQPMGMEKIAQRVGVSMAELNAKYKNTRFFNHIHDKPGELTAIGTIPAEEINEISHGLMQEDVTVTLNKLIFNYDFLIIISPVVPHEVAGFSGGNKYLFPGISGADFIHFFHWLAAVITNQAINGTKINPVRDVLNRAASFLKIPRLCFNMVIHDGKIRGLFIGDVEQSWSDAADLSAKLHIKYVEHSFHKVLGIAPTYYDDIWVAGKVMYKLEPIIADGGELIIYAPHIKEVSYTHGSIIRKIGYHVRDYFLKQMDKFSDIPRGIMAHSTHVKGVGTFENGIEKPRVRVVLATGIPEEICKQINLGYRDPATIDLTEWEGKQEQGILLVEKAGEILYKLKQ